MPEAPIRVVVADDSDTVRQLLRRWLSAEFGFAIVGEARNGRVGFRIVVLPAFRTPP